MSDVRCINCLEPVPAFDEHWWSNYEAWGWSCGPKRRLESLPGMFDDLCDCHGLPRSDCTNPPLPPGYPMTPPTIDETKKKIQRAALITDIMDEVRAELTKAMATFPAFNSAHEGFAVIQEEFSKELWDEVCAKQGARSLDNMRKEAVQVAAMAIRFIHDICNPDKIQK